MVYCIVELLPVQATLVMTRNLRDVAVTSVSETKSEAKTAHASSFWMHTFTLPADFPIITSQREGETTATELSLVVNVTREVTSTPSAWTT